MSQLQIDQLSLQALAAMPSAATMDLENATGDLIDISGTTTITRILLQAGHERTVRFTGILTLTHGANLVLPGAANITTAAGDFAVFRGYSDGVVRCIAYQGASGIVTPEALALKAPLSPSVREITAATDTILQADNGKIIKANRGTAQTFTVTGPIAAGFNCVIHQAGAGLVTIAAGGGASLVNRQSHTDSAGQHAILSLIADTADVVVLAGDTA